MGSRLSPDADTAGPSFGVSLVAVLAGGFIASWISALFFGFAPYLTHTAWTVATSLFGAYGVKFVLGMLGYEIGIIPAFAALALGSIIGVGMLSAMPRVAGPGMTFLPAFGTFSGIVSLLLSTGLVHTVARSSTKAMRT